MVPENRELFLEMTVEENLEMGAFTRRDGPGIREDFARAFQIFPRLQERRQQIAGPLSGGEQQMLATGRALMANPRILLMDEPSMGLAPVLVDGIFEIIHQLYAEGTNILLVEQNVFNAMNMSDRAYVIENGRIVLNGSGADLLKDEHLKRAYLGI